MGKTIIKHTGIFKRINTQYRIVFINDESLEEVASFRLTMRKLYALLSTVFIVIVILTTSVLLATSLKYYIPGYGSNKMHLQIIKLKRNVDSLSDLVEMQHDYENNMRKVISGSYTGQPDTTKLDMK